LALEIVEEVKNPHQTTLGAFSCALARQTHVLTNQPDLLSQQLYNRQQWEGEEVEARLAPERQRRSRPGSRPWINRYTRLRESDALVRTLAGHSAGVNACAVSNESRR